MKKLMASTADAISFLNNMKKLMASAVVLSMVLVGCGSSSKKDTKKARRLSCFFKNKFHSCVKTGRFFHQAGYFHLFLPVPAMQPPDRLQRAMPAVH